MSYVNKSEELKSLQHALSLYTQTTDALILNFVNSQKNQGKNHFLDKQTDRYTESITCKKYHYIACHIFLLLIGLQMDKFIYEMDALCPKIANTKFQASIFYIN